MSVRVLLSSLVFITACADDGAVVGPYTGQTHRFVIDAIDLPTSTSIGRSLGEDLDGNGTIDNQLGVTVGGLMTFGDAQQHVADQIASGAIASFVEIQADDLTDDDTVGVTFYGREDGERMPRSVGGRITGGVFEPNHIRDVDSTHTGKALLRLPVFADVDAIDVWAESLEIRLAPDGTGGYEAWLSGAIDANEALEEAYVAILEQLVSYPEDHRSMWTLVDRNLDGVFSADELRTGLIASFLAPDVSIVIDDDMRQMLSFSLHVHLAPCASGRCGGTTIGDTCFDRVHDGDETDVDCGGSCGIACAGERACAVDADCQSSACNGSTCAPVSCFDGVKNGLEASVDCGGACDAGCARGQVCGYDFDCQSNRCTATTATGVCQ